jgi:methionyl-tRNA synthetase
MIQNQKRYTITAALPYTNGPIHIGHLAGVYGLLIFILVT